MSLQSRVVGCGEGESGEKNSCGDSLSLVKRTADAKTSKDAVQAPAGFNVPFGKFFSSFPGQMIDGTEDSAKVIARPLACGPLGFPILKWGGTLVAATTCFQE